MRRLLSIGWVGQGDFGDEAMAYALRGVLGRRGFGPPKPYLAGPHPSYRAKGEWPPPALYAGDQPAWRQKFFDPIHLRAYDTVLVGGGSVLHSSNSISWKLAVIERIRRNSGRAAFAASVGVSVGPFPDPEAERLCAAYLAENDLIITRDDASARIAAGLCPSARVLPSRDTSLAVPGIDPDAWKQATRGGRQARTIAVSFVRKEDGRPVHPEDPDVKRYAGILKGLLTAGWEVRLFTLHVGRHYRDAELNELLRRTASHPDRVGHHVFDGDIYRTVSALHGCGLSLSSRLHGIVFSYMLGIPFVSLGYHRKNSDFCETIRYPRALVLDGSAPEPEAVLAAVRAAADPAADPFRAAEPFARAAAITRQNLDALCDGLAGASL